jgi:hypothetical protein
VIIVGAIPCFDTDGKYETIRTLQCVSTLPKNTERKFKIEKKNTSNKKRKQNKY